MDGPRDDCSHTGEVLTLFMVLNRYARPVLPKKRHQQRGQIMKIGRTHNLGTASTRCLRAVSRACHTCRTPKFLNQINTRCSLAPSVMNDVLIDGKYNAKPTATLACYGNLQLNSSKLHLRQVTLIIYCLVHLPVITAVLQCDIIPLRLLAPER
jgi:hypothetical protein